MQVQSVLDDIARLRSAMTDVQALAGIPHSGDADDERLRRINVVLLALAGKSSYGPHDRPLASLVSSGAGLLANEVQRLVDEIRRLPDQLLHSRRKLLDAGKIDTTIRVVSLSDFYRTENAPVPGDPRAQPGRVGRVVDLIDPDNLLPRIIEPRTVDAGSPGWILSRNPTAKFFELPDIEQLTGQFASAYKTWTVQEERRRQVADIEWSLTPEGKIAELKREVEQLKAEKGAA